MPSSVVQGFPSPRPDRATSAVAAPVGGGAAPRYPNVRIWPLHIQETNGVAVVVSEQMQGPAVIDSLVVQMAMGSPLPFPTFSIYVSESGGGGGNNFALNTVPSGTRLVDNLSFQREDANTSTDNRGWNAFNIVENTGLLPQRLGLLVQLPTFFIKIRVQNQVAAQGAAMWGYMRVLEGIPPDQVPNFL